MLRKCTVLALLRIRTYARKNTLIFCLFLLGAVLSSLSFLFFYGNSMADKRNVARNSLSYRTFTLYGDRNCRNWTMKDLQSLWDSASGSLDVRVSHTVKLPAASEYPELSVQAFLNNNAGVYFYQGQTSFTPEQLEQDCAIAPSNSGDSLNLEGMEFPVVGRTHHFSNDVVFIPIRSFLENGFSPDSVELILDTIPTRKENNRILEQLSILFPETSITDPYQSIRTDQSRNPGGVAMISGIYLISILSFLFLFQYLMQENSYENVVYSLVGARKTSVVCIACMELTLLSGGSALLAGLLHAALYNPFFVHINIYGQVPYTLWDYSLCFFLTVALSLAALTPFLATYTHRSLAEMKRQFQQ